MYKYSKSQCNPVPSHYFLRWLKAYRFCKVRGFFLLTVDRLVVTTYKEEVNRNKNDLIIMLLE